MNGIDLDPPKARDNVAKALVAFPYGMVVWCYGELLKQSVHEDGHDIANLALLSANPSPTEGIHVWEGMYEVTTTCGYPDPPEYDVEGWGEWREPTEEEWTKIMKQENPWK